MLSWLRKTLLAFMAISLSLSAAPAEMEWLSQGDVRRVMNRIFEYHVDKHEMSPLIFKRALKVYIDQFDPERIYLLEDDVDKYLNADQALLAQMMREYYRGELATFDALDEVIKASIYRARSIRDEMEAEAAQLFADEPEELDRPRYPKPEFADSEGELKERIRDRLLRFIAQQRKKVGEAGLKGKEQKVLSLYERNLRGAEDRRLDLDEDHQLLSDEEKEHFLTLRSLKALAKSLDSHTAFFSAQEAYDMRVRLEKGFFGIGIILQESIDGISVVRLIDGGPAKDSGLIREQDRLVEVDGVPVAGYSFDTVLDMVRGQEGSTVTLGLVRAEGTEEHFFNVQLQRRQIVMNDSRVDVSYQNVEDGIIGTIVLHSFYDGENGISSERDIRNAIRELYQVGNLKGLILDLRENTGGFLMQAVKVAGLFITNGVVVVSQYADGETRYFRDIDGHSYYDGPLIVLTSKASASAAEIVAQTLQDYGSALIVGDERTYGKGSIQHQTVTGGDKSSFFKVTVGRYFTVSGRSTQIEGVKADIVVPTEFHEEQIGEKFLDFPLSNETINSAYVDRLEDIDPGAKRWYAKYYLPSLQNRKEQYRALLPVLRERSRDRLQASQTYQAFLKLSRGEEPANDSEAQLFERVLRNLDEEDPPLVEANEIMKDIIMLVPNSGSMDKLFTDKK